VVSLSKVRLDTTPQGGGPMTGPQKDHGPECDGCLMLQMVTERDAARAALDTLRTDVRSVVNTQHQRVEPEQFGLVSWPSCSCGRTETRAMPDNTLSIVPAQHPCADALAMLALLDRTADNHDTKERHVSD
jgi:hypothetical protein